MKRILLVDLHPSELEALEFNLYVVGATDEEKQFAYDNLFRDEKGVAYYTSSVKKRLIVIYPD